MGRHPPSGRRRAPWVVVPLVVLVAVAMGVAVATRGSDGLPGLWLATGSEETSGGP